MSIVRALQNNLQESTGVNDRTIRNRLHKGEDPVVKVEILYWAPYSLPSTTAPA